MRRKTIITISLLFCLVAPIGLLSQVPIEGDFVWPLHRMGFRGSMMSGYGLYYENQALENYAIIGNLFCYGESKTNNNNDKLIADIGIEIQRNLKRTEQTRFYVLLGTYYDYYENQNSYYDGKYSDIERYFNIGTGFGFEMIFREALSINLDCGYYGRFGKNSTYNGTFRETLSPKSFGFGVGCGVSFAI